MKKEEAVKVITSIHLDFTKSFDPDLQSDILITKLEKYELGKIHKEAAQMALAVCSKSTYTELAVRL